MTTTGSQRDVQIGDLVFVGFNRRVIALDRYTGEMVWWWKAPRSGNPVLLLDRDRLVVSINGYMYCLDPVFGQLAWSNELKGMGLGIPTLASARGGSTQSHAHQHAQQQAAAAS